MLVLFDHGTPRSLARVLPDHAVGKNSMCSCPPFSKLEIQRELDLAGAGSGNRLPKSRYRRQT